MSLLKYLAQYYRRPTKINSKSNHIKIYEILISYSLDISLLTKHSGKNNFELRIESVVLRGKLNLCGKVGFHYSYTCTSLFSFILMPRYYLPCLCSQLISSTSFCPSFFSLGRVALRAEYIENGYL